MFSYTKIIINEKLAKQRYFFLSKSVRTVHVNDLQNY